MEPDREPPHRPLGEALATGFAAGAIAGLATGAIDALWSWAPAAQFVPGVTARLRAVAFAATSYGLAGAIAGLTAAAGLLGLVRGSRLGDLMQFALREHRDRRDRDPRAAVAGLSLVLAAVPCAAAALVIAFRVTVPYVTHRHVIALEVAVAMTATVVALAIAAPIAFVVARGIEAALARLAGRARFVSSPWAPPVALAVLLATAAAAWAARDWETARQLPLRPPVVLAVAGALALAALRPGRAAVRARHVRLARLGRGRRLAGWLAMPAIWLGLLGLVLATGGSPAVIKAASAYTGLGGPISRTLRRAFDRDGDGHARFLGGGDCDDGDPSVHPGAPEIPDDGIDQNCLGGDATAHRAPPDPAFRPVPPGVPRDANILLITIDTTRADHLGMYGYPRPTSPNLDAMAREATVFEHGWAHAPSTRYSMPAILTGRLPLDVHYDTSVEGWPGLLPRATTIAEALAPLGFVTGAITSYWYFDRIRHMDQGFAEYDNDDARLHTGVAGAGPEQTRGSSSKQQTDKAIGFVTRHAAERWFLWVHYYDPHYAYEPHPEVGSFAPSSGADRVALYDGELRFTDLHIGRLLDELRAHRLYDRTIIVVTGDHGEGFGEHGIELHGYHLYAAQTRVPLIIRVPGLPPRRAATPAGHADLLPTLVNLAGGAASPDMMGRSLVDALAGADVPRTIFQQLSYEGNHEMRAGVDAHCHVIYNASPDPSWEVYRVDRDPLEAHDLADGDECAGTRRAVEQWVDAEQVPPGAAEALLPARPAIAAPLDADLGDAARLLAVDVRSAETGSGDPAGSAGAAAGNAPRGIDARSTEMGGDPAGGAGAAAGNAPGGITAPARVRPGDTIALTWTFEARGQIAPGWRVFVHVTGPGPSGAFFNGDHRPARPFEWWRAGQYIRYTSSVTVPRGAAPGHYVVWAGLFDTGLSGTARAGRRAPARAPRARVVDNAVAVAELEVAP